MPRSGKKAGRRVNRQISKADIGDVTINDFANSVVCTSGRLKKSSIPVNNVVKEVKQLNLLAVDQTWEEKVENLEVSNNETVAKKSSSGRRKRTVTSGSEDDQTGYDYPIDIWFLISEYILPEDVGKFAAICKTSQAVVSTAKFWFSLYKRFYRKVPNMPEYLQPEYTVRLYGLRAHVIRALHFMYPPFVEKLKPQLSFDGDPHLLIKRQCVLAWSQKIKNHWLFSFKLKKVRTTRYGIGNEEGNGKLDLSEMLEDINANRDDNCKVLQVTSPNYINLPMLSGQILSDVTLNVNRGMNHRLQINFGSGPFPSQSSNPVILDPVVNVRVLDWWHPSFPHSYGLNSSLFSAETHNQQFDELEF